MSAAVPAVQPFVRTAAQIGALRELAGEWRRLEGFWEFDDVLAALAKPGSLGFFAAPAADAPAWEGMVLADVGPYTADLLYIFVRPGARGRGVGGALFTALRQALAAKPQIEALFLEVRETNVAAQSLYKRFAMKPIGRRSRYYADGENALVYKLDLHKLDSHELDLHGAAAGEEPG
jgi:ribosomal-protein-alanine N-acetyltransferase